MDREVSHMLITDGKMTCLLVDRPQHEWRNVETL